jgi:multidrug efflux system outer membrane protein
MDRMHLQGEAGRPAASCRLPLRAPALPPQTGTRLGLATLTLALAACAPLKPLPEPEAALPAEFAGAASGASEALADARWWTLIDDPDLPGLVETALRNNRDLKRAIARIDEADAVLRLNGAALLPQVNADAGALRNRVTEVGAVPLPANAPVYRSDQRLALTTTYEVDVWRRLRDTREASRASLLAARETADAVAMTLAGTVAQTVVSLRATDLSLELSRRTLASRGESLRLIRIRRAEGVGSELEERQAEAAQESLRAQLLQLERSRGLLQNQLALLCGEPSASLPARPDLAMPEAPVPPAGLPSALLERPARHPRGTRPDAGGTAADAGGACRALSADQPHRQPRSAERRTCRPAHRSRAYLVTGARTHGTSVRRRPCRGTHRPGPRAGAAAQAAYEGAVLTAFREVSDALVNLEQDRRIEQALAAQRDASAAAARVRVAHPLRGRLLRLARGAGRRAQRQHRRAGLGDGATDAHRRHHRPAQGAWHRLAGRPAALRGLGPPVHRRDAA